MHPSVVIPLISWASHPTVLLSLSVVVVQDIQHPAVSLGRQLCESWVWCFRRCARRDYHVDAFWIRTLVLELACNTYVHRPVDILPFRETILWHGRTCALVPGWRFEYSNEADGPQVPSKPGESWRISFDMAWVVEFLFHVHRTLPCLAPQWHQPIKRNA